jgi:hypothetical protein
MYTLITENCPGIPCTFPAVLEREEIEAAMSCFQSLDVDRLSETCKPVLGPLLGALPKTPQATAEVDTSAQVDTTQIGTKQSRAIVAKFAAIKPFCPSVTCDTSPVSDEAVQASVVCLGSIDMTRLSPGCVDALKAQSEQQVMVNSNVRAQMQTRLGPRGNVLYGKPRTTGQQNLYGSGR